MRDTFWLALGIAFLAAALFVLARFAIGDRARGRRRCPKCWYDMAGVIGACPECGRKIRSERELARTRRPRRWMALALVLLSAALAAGRQAMPFPAVRLVPDWVLIASIGQPWQRHVFPELQRRHWEVELSAREQRRLIQKSMRLVRDRDDPVTLSIAMSAIRAAEGRERYEPASYGRPWSPWVKPSDLVDSGELLLAVLPKLSHPDTNVASDAESTLWQFKPEFLLAFPTAFSCALHDLPASRGRLLGSMIESIGQPYGPLGRPLRATGRAPNPDLLRFVQTLLPAQYDRNLLRERLRDGLADESELVRLLAMWIIRGAFWPDEEFRSVVLAGCDPASKLTGPAAVDFAVSGPIDDPALRVIRAALQAADGERWVWIAQRLGERGPDAAPLTGDLRAALGTELAQKVAVPYARVSGDTEGAARALLTCELGGGPAREVHRIRKLQEVGWNGPEVLAFCREHLRSDRPEVRAAAAVALLHIAPPQGLDRPELTRIGAQASLERHGSSLREIYNAIKRGDADMQAVLDAIHEHGILADYPLLRCIGLAGSAAAPAIPWLRSIVGPGKGDADTAAWAIRRIEWSLEHGDPPARDPWW